MRSALAVCFVFLGCSSAFAIEYCVSCEGPQATYRCAMEGPTAGANDTRAQYLCITELAKSGKHQTCSVARTRVAPCSGELKTIAMPDSIDEPQPSAPQPAATGLTVAPGSPSASASDVSKTGLQADGLQGRKPPAKRVEAPDQQQQTLSPEPGPQPSQEPSQAEKVQTAVSDAAKSTGETIGKAGSAVSSAAKKTWDCMTSLFQGCSGE